MTENTPTQFDTRLGITIDLNPVSMADGGPGLPVELCESTIDDLRQDIAHALACIPRFAGHTLVPWTVAQHSIAVALYLARSGATRDDVLAGLLHDAHEGLGLGDIPSPAARALGPEGHAMLAAIKEHLDLLVEDVYDGNDGSRPSRMLLSRSTSAGPAPHLAADRAILLAEQALLRHRNSAPTEPVDPEAIGAVLSVAFGTPTTADRFQWCVDALENAGSQRFAAGSHRFADGYDRVLYASVDDARQKLAQRRVREILELNTVEGKGDVLGNAGPARENLEFFDVGPDSANACSITAWARRVYELACEKGWHDDSRPRGEELAIHLMNLHSEISECWEAYRAGKLDQPCDKAERMREMGLRPLTCLEEELADIVIRVMDDAVALDVDLEAAMDAKHAYNASRSRRHGGKLA